MLGTIHAGFFNPARKRKNAHNAGRFALSFVRHVAELASNLYAEGSATRFESNHGGEHASRGFIAIQRRSADSGPLQRPQNHRRNVLETRRNAQTNHAATRQAVLRSFRACQC